ncbi:SDR family oxidoreductase [Candidatus Poribacteria bacterium]|nr:SDR family oxidoreductase [Candidatus Poribacteria bacterium]
MSAELRVLVTGASGFVGERLVRRLACADFRVTGTYCDHPIEFEGARCVRSDLSDGKAISTVLQEAQPHVVVHCAALTNVELCEQNPTCAQACILDATRELVRACAAFPLAPRLIAPSTDLVFDGENPRYRESDPAKPVSVYGSLKHDAECWVLESPGGVVIRSALLYGALPSFRAGFLDWMIAQLQRAEPLELFEDEIRTPLAVEDLCEVIRWFIENGATGLWHAGGPQRLTRLEMGRLLCQAGGWDEKLLVPRRLSESKYAAPRPRDVSLDSASLWQRTGLAPRSLFEALKQRFDSAPDRGI